jgi:hypothetical protein
VEYVVALGGWTNVLRSLQVSKYKQA